MAKKNPVVHFEIYADDPAKLAQFYKGLFDWTMEPLPGMDYQLIRTVDTDAKGMPTQAGGINGGMMRRPAPEVPGTINYVSVESLDGALERAQKLGAEVMKGRAAVPGRGWFVILQDPQGNAFALWQQDAQAK
jgi:predicted enzyme related to lactoylglutathione lyase